jgi:hypothetical protein
LIGSDKGVRLAQPAANGDLQIGALLSTGPCRCFEGQDRFVWFGWDNYDSLSTGVGRLDLNQINTDAPAYTSDLMVTGQGQVSDVATFAGKRVLAVSGLGFYTESANLVPSGTLDSGLITYDLPEDKVAYYLDVKYEDPLSGTVVAYLSADSSGFLLVGSRTSALPEGPFTLGETRGATFEVRTELDRDTTPTVGPVVTRLSLRSNPAVDTGLNITVPLLLAEQVTLRNEKPQTVNVASEYAYLLALRAAGQAVTYQEGKTTYSVTVQDIQRNPTHATGDGNAWNSTTIVKLKTV